MEIKTIGVNKGKNTWDYACNVYGTMSKTTQRSIAIVERVGSSNFEDL